MGLETQIAELNQNIVALNKTVASMMAYREQKAVEAEPAVAPEAEVDKKQAKASKPKAKAEAAPAATPEPKAEPAVADGEERAAYDYEDVKTALLSVSRGKGRDAAIAVLQRFGVKKAPELSEAQYADVIDMANKIAAGELDPEEALA